jgi:hypothetical protein
MLAHLTLLCSRACLTTLSACGLRLHEDTHVQGPDIDCARLLVQGRCGNGAPDRDGPLPPRPLELRPPGHAMPARGAWRPSRVAWSVLAWSNARTSAASIAPPPARHAALRCRPRPCGPGRTWRRVAPRGWAGRCPIVRPAKTLMRATTRGRTGRAPSASRRKLSSGWNTSRVCCCPSSTSWAPTPSLMH